MSRAEIVPAPAPWVERMTVANKMLAEIADDPFRASRVWDFAEAARVYAIQVGLGVEAVNHAVAVKLKAQRLLAEAVDNGQAKGEIATRQTAHKRSSPTPGDDPPRTLGEIGVTQQRVSEARKIAHAFTEDDIDTAAADATLAGEELSSAQMLARAREVAIVRAKPTDEATQKRETLRLTAARFHSEFRAHLLSLDPAYVAGSIPADEWEVWDATGRDCAKWFAALKAARPERLRAIK